MNSHHNNGENDRSLNETLDKLGQSYAKLGQDEPPELVDMAILNSAHRALEKKPHWMKFGWLHGLTTAAVFVLALSVVIHQRESQPVNENGIDPGQFSRSRPESPEKLQSSEVQSGDSRQALKRTGNERRELSVSTAAAPEAAPPAAVMEDAADAMTESMYVSHEPQADIGSKKEDDQMDPGEIAEPSAPAVETEENRQPDVEAEQQLLAIIKMKQGGNENWKTELEAFIESHPDYPLPDELKN